MLLPKWSTKCLTVSCSSFVNRPILTVNKKACGPGAVIPMHFTISFVTCSLVISVSNIPGVSTKTILRSNLLLIPSLHLFVTEAPEALESNLFFPRIVFPVALFPVPVFPMITIRSSSTCSFPVFWCFLLAPSQKK